MKSCVSFGKKLLDKNDLDPIYVMLYNSELSQHSLQKWLIAYWCFYDSGTASWITDQKKYWSAMRKCANDPKAKRGTERRHFRTDNANRSLNYLETCGISKLFEPLLGCTTYGGVQRVVSGWTGFGPWITFKIADMLECLELTDISFDIDDVFYYQSPLEGARRLAVMKGKDFPTSSKKDVATWATKYLINQLNNYYAPPSYNRDIGIQEVETVLCKWKSYLNGHYKIGKDVESLKNSLYLQDSPIAYHLYESAIKGELWE